MGAGVTAPTPAPAPLAMPAQDLRRAPRARFASQSWRVYAARLVAFGGAAALTIYASDQMLRAFDPEGVNALQLALRALFVLTFGWIAFSGCSTIAGLLFPPRRDRGDPGAPLTTRTAIVMPVYNEDAAASFGALSAMGRGLAALGHAEAFEIFILSDTRDPDAWARETTAFAALRRRMQGGPAIWWRRRAVNRGRKAGNVQDFVERWGARYDFMLVLDADSLMEPETIVEMVRRMQAAPRLALLQSNPALAGGTTPFARIQQFAGAVYGRVVARGVAAWQGTDGNFWGHNALIRMRAFAESAGLPELRGRRPFGGHILSHDFVEAALLRRAGWDVRMDPDLGGSWEGAPPSLLTSAARDRRWAQGNVQHAAVLPAAGLRLLSRVHFLIGIGAYLVSPIWLAMILVGLALTAQSALLRPEYFSDAVQLFPRWPRFDSERMAWLFAGSTALLLLPKALGALEAAARPELAARFGGRGRVAGGVGLEIVLSALLAPALMLIQARQIIEILLGRDSGWKTQERAGSVLPWRDALSAHGWHAVIGLGGGALLWFVQPGVLVWLSPILLGLALAPLLSRLSGDARAGSVMARRGLLDSPEDRAKPDIALAAEAAAASIGREMATGLADLARSPRLLADHAAAIEPPAPLDPQRDGEPALARLTAAAKLAAAPSAEAGLGWLTLAERAAVAACPELLTAGGRARLAA